MIEVLGWMRRFLAIEAASGLCLIGAAGFALILANSVIADGFERLIDGEMGWGLPSLHTLTNDGLMSGFFLLVGLELKREMIEGALASPRAAMLPVAAALGGMVAPVLLYWAVAHGDYDLQGGWAIPVATDIAFALATLTLLGRRVPPQLKVFLTALAIIDDWGAVLIIAFFYTSTITLWALGLAGLLSLVLFLLNRNRVAAIGAYLIVGCLLWWAFDAAGLHPTLAGVITAAAIPMRMGKAGSNPLHRLETVLHPWIAFGVMPVFGFVNAGVTFSILPGNVLGNPLILGIFFGLVLGKPLGIGMMIGLARYFRMASLPHGVSFLQIMGLACLCGIGFTMCLFIGYLAFPNAPDQRQLVKCAVLLASCVSAVFGIVLLLLAPPVAAKKET